MSHIEKPTTKVNSGTLVVDTMCTTKFTITHTDARTS